jgi:hypothetical protein
MHIAHQGTGMDVYQLCSELFTVLRSGETDDDIQMTLVERLGYEALDFISELIGHRSTIVHNIIRLV